MYIIVYNVPVKIDFIKTSEQNFEAKNKTRPP